MIIQGPLAPRWRRRKFGILPRLENGELSEVNPPTPERADLWSRQQIGVAGRDDWIFVKVHTHGCVAGSRRMLLGEVMREFHRHLGARYNDGSEWCLHYLTGREMYNVAKAAEAGQCGNPGAFRDYEIGTPPFQRPGPRLSPAPNSDISR